ncbi:uncharacterized protein F5147DRAFT_779119 [Suillus discolor]|uniref:Uncharacterized protein n=1 Tax=Suillus discolor TaxID=1912936 RepID=A0A9P7EVS7_9AGAM|nr:uncharacterized protein F5147DRAFT_779119 [Suillus discolor]KAG2094018.1 hypothetical protein F5147DRAFT_779119 [Suillus discolor]
MSCPSSTDTDEATLRQLTHAQLQKVAKSELIIKEIVKMTKLGALVPGPSSQVSKIAAKASVNSSLIEENDTSSSAAHADTITHALTIEEIMEFAEHLTIKDIITEGGPNSFSYSAKRRRADILEVVQGSAEMQKVIIRAYNRKKERRKRRRGNNRSKVISRQRRPLVHHASGDTSVALFR